MILRRLGWKFKTPEFNKGSANYDLIFEPFIKLNKTYLGDNKFRFLNREINFIDNINWNYSDNGKLWTYNINYFEFLMQEDISESEGRKLIDNYINSYDRLKDGLESFPTSLRLLNWVKFLIKYQIRDDKINRFIHEDAYRLYHHPEYHLLGNHLLENGFGLYFAAVYLNDPKLYKKSKSVLTAELEEQILSDGAHFELSTMYHQHMLFRVLDSYQLASQNEAIGSELKELFLAKAALMLSWLKNISFSNGDTPLLNDSAKNIAPDSEQLFEYATYLKIEYELSPLDHSGYRKYKAGNFELIADVGDIGPDYIPGHAHADTLSFVLNLGDDPVLVDSGTSTYESGEIRQAERSTSAHNTVVVNTDSSSEVWAAFRVGDRATTQIHIDTEAHLQASHDGYSKFHVTHHRDFVFKEKSIEVIDTLHGDISKLKSQKAYFHLHPDRNVSISDQTIKIGQNINIEFRHALNVSVEEYNYAELWNQRIEALVIIAEFNETLTTIISEV